MDIREKIIEALSGAFTVDYVRLDDDDGITGFVVSPRFQGMSTLDRQLLIEDALRKTTTRLTPQEVRQVLMIAGLTPAEYDTVGARITVHNVNELAGGAVEVLLYGAPSDAEYVRGALKHQKGIKTTEPKRVPGAVGTLMSFQARGSATTPLTKARAIRILKNDQYIQVMPNA